jgi:hypothetical protein
MRELYQRLYNDQSIKYGSAAHDMSPGVRFLPYYQQHIKGDVVDYGGGTGDTARVLRERGFSVFAVDWVHLKGVDLVADITQPIVFKGTNPETGLCLDVFEHIDDTGLEGLCLNLSRCQRQVISVHVGESIIDPGLHINRKSFEQWDLFMRERFNVVEVVEVPDHHESRLYLSTSKT